MSKYKSKKVTIDGITFDSKDEIKDFGLQEKFVLQDSFMKDGKKYRAITYTPDFAIFHNDGSVEYVDVKSLGTATQQGELRRKIWDFRYRDKKLTWICRNLKHATIDGQWIVYEDLKKIYREKKKGA